MAASCPSCGQVLPDDVGVCPNCGQPVPIANPKRTLPINIIIPAVLVIAIVTGGIWWFLKQNPVAPDLRTMTAVAATQSLERAVCATTVHVVSLDEAS